MIYLETKLLNTMLPAVSVDDTRPHLQGLYIRDIEDTREYYATNGHVLLFAKTKIKGDKLPISGIMLKLKNKIKGKQPFIDMWFKGENAQLLNQKNNIICEVEFTFFEDICRLINETDDNVQRDLWLPFQPRYLQILCDFFECFALDKPYTDKEELCADFRACKWKYDNKLALLMPCRV